LKRSPSTEPWTGEGKEGEEEGERKFSFFPIREKSICFWPSLNSQKGKEGVVSPLLLPDRGEKEKKTMSPHVERSPFLEA